MDSIPLERGQMIGQQQQWEKNTRCVWTDNNISRIIHREKIKSYIHISFHCHLLMPISRSRERILCLALIIFVLILIWMIIFLKTGLNISWNGSLRVATEKRNFSHSLQDYSVCTIQMSRILYFCLKGFTTNCTFCFFFCQVLCKSTVLRVMIKPMKPNINQLTASCVSVCVHASGLTWPAASRRRHRAPAVPWALQTLPCTAPTRWSLGQSDRWQCGGWCCGEAA